MAAWLQRQDVIVGGRLFLELPSFLRHRISRHEARQERQRRFERRQQDFLSLADQAIYRNPESPYLRLLTALGCDRGDLEKLVLQEDVEGALEHLYRLGLYLTVNEFKGITPVIRGSANFWVHPAAFVNPTSNFDILNRSSGSRGPASIVPVDLASLHDRAINTLLALDARGGARWSHAIWIVPGGSGLSLLLQYAALGISTSRWFSQVDPTARPMHPRYLWSIRALRMGGWLGRLSFPAPGHAPVDDPAAIFAWVDDVKKEGRTPHLQTFPSSASQLCRLAADKGVDLTGLEFSIGGEPVTAARLDCIRRAGASAVPHYGSVEAGRIAEGCLDPEFPDECHLFDDLNAVIEAGSGRQASQLPSSALLVSSLRPTTPLVLLNLSLGDQGVIRSRECGCPLSEKGWIKQVHTIRSFEKLTAGGMTFVDSDLVEVLDRSLPARFGGSAADYQLLETEDTNGNPRLKLLVAPKLEDIDHEAVKSFFFLSIGKTSEAAGLMARFWQEANLMEVIRQPPHRTPGGKILHIHQSPGARA